MKRIYIKYGTYFLLGFLLALVVLSNINLNKKDLDKPSKDILKGNANIVAVSNNGNGVLGRVNVNVIKGDGKVLINTNPFLEPDTQYSANVATKVAQEVTKKDLSERDVIFDFDIESSVVGGPSAGAAMTIALISALEGKNLTNNFVVTGTIMLDGGIGQIGGIVEKAEVANKFGIRTFIVPNGQSIFKYYEKEVSKKQIKKGFTLYNTYYVPKELNLTRYYEEQGKMKIEEVKNIYDLYDLVF